MNSNQRSDWKDLKLGQPVLFNGKKTGTNVSNKLFKLSVIDTLTPVRVTEVARAIISRALQRNKIVKRVLRLEDIIIMAVPSNVGEVTEGNIKIIDAELLAGGPVAY